MSTSELEVTRRLAEWVCESDFQTVPDPVREEAARTLLNWMGCAVGGSRHESVDITLRALGPFMGQPQASVLGRAERADVLHASLLNGISSHVFDFDDTHLRTIIHPAGPVASALVPLAEHRPVSGHDFLHALVLGVEVECRIGNAVYPDHYDAGWHITGTAGVFGAAAAAGRLLGLDVRRMCWAFAAAATQAAGLREMFGTMCKPFHIGRAAQNGLAAALLAAEGLTGSERAIEAPRGFARVLSTKQDYAAICDGLGDSYEILLNTYKPYPCGVVIHPSLDGCIRMKREHGLAGDDIEAVELRVPPPGAGAHRQQDAAHRPRGQVQRVPRRGRRARSRAGRCHRVHRRGRAGLAGHRGAGSCLGRGGRLRTRGRRRGQGTVEGRAFLRGNRRAGPREAWSVRCPTRPWKTRSTSSPIPCWARNRPGR